MDSNISREAFQRYEQGRAAYVAGCPFDLNESAAWQLGWRDGADLAYLNSATAETCERDTSIVHRDYDLDLDKLIAEMNLRSLVYLART